MFYDIQNAAPDNSISGKMKHFFGHNINPIHIFSYFQSTPCIAIKIEERIIINIYCLC